MRTITALLVSVALAVPAPVTLAQEALSRGAEAEAFKQLAAGIPLGSRVKVRTTDGRRLTATLMAVEDERIVQIRGSRANPYTGGVICTKRSCSLTVWS